MAGQFYGSQFWSGQYYTDGDAPPPTPTNPGNSGGWVWKLSDFKKGNELPRQGRHPVTQRIEAIIARAIDGPPPEELPDLETLKRQIMGEIAPDIQALTAQINADAARQAQDYANGIEDEMFLEAYFAEDLLTPYRAAEVMVEAVAPLILELITEGKSVH